MYGIKINTDASSLINSTPLYQIGDNISFVLQVDYEDVGSIGNTLQLEIRDIYGNIITSLSASRINDIYVAEYTVPLSLHKSYNILGAPSLDGNPNLFSLSDNWIFPDTTELSFPFNVQRTAEDPVAINCEYVVSILGLLADDGNIADDITFRFTSSLTPYYSSVMDVKGVHTDILGEVDDFDMVRQIFEISRYIDVQMAPTIINRHEQFELARRMYTKYEVARIYLNSWLNTSKETKKLDTFEYSRDSGNPDRLLKKIEEYVDKYAYVIWAGGNDTPFVPKTFTKGILDPNRVNANRVGIDTSDPYPWVNTTTQNFTTEINGNTVELRGTRTVSFLKGRSSFPNVFLRSEGVS